MSSESDPHSDVCDVAFSAALVADHRIPYLRAPGLGYGIPRIPGGSAEAWWEKPDIVAVSFCPWCGRRLE